MVNINATRPTTTLERGTTYVVDLTPLFTGTTKSFETFSTLPPGLSLYATGTSLRGTPTTVGTWQVSLEGLSGRGDPNGKIEKLSIVVTAPATVIPAPAAARIEDGYMLPAVEGVRWTVNGVETAPGSYSVQPVTETTTVTIVPRPAEGYVFPVEPEALVLTFEPAPAPDPDPDPDPDPEPEPEPGPGDESTWATLMDDDPQALYVATRLADRIIRHVGRDVAELEPAEVLTARDHAMVVLEYVKGYTRARGFVGYIPHRSLQAVIVAAAARLFTNPEQLTYYSTGDYSERPATMTGWTAAELGVLRRFRKVYA